MNPRHAQLSYTSFDAAGGQAGGGWQVKQTTGELRPDETDALVAGVRTVFNAADPLPAYPTPADCERGPRRLAYRRTSADAAAHWHTVPAGIDGTGRPGNVFAHVLLDRAADEPAGHRPIQLWRSPGWVRPYGAAEVARALLPAEPPSPGGVVTKASVLHFVLDTRTWRLGTLCGLLDAVAAALAGGAPVVLGVASDDVAAQWIGLVSFLMSAGTAGRFGFATFDRCDQLSADLHLTAVPLGDLASVPEGFVVIDETAMLSMGELDAEPHRTAAGQPIAVTPWSVMAQVTLIDSTSGRRVLDDVDRHAADAGDRGLHPAWPMAMSVLNRDEFADARGEAAEVIARYSPTGLSEDSVLGRTVSGALTELLGTSTADAWRVVTRAPEGRPAERADVEYLRRAVADLDWLTQPATVPVGPRGHGGATVSAELTASIGPALAAAAAAGPEPLIRLVDLGWRAGVPDERLGKALASPLVTNALIEPRSGVELARRLGELIGWPTRVEVAAEVLLASGPGADATTPLADEVLNWFADGLNVPAPVELAAAAPWDRRWTRAALRGARAQRFGAADDGDRFAQLWWLRICGSPAFQELAGSSIWEPRELRAAAGGASLGAEALPTLLGAADSPDMDELATAVMDASADPAAAACAAVRAIDPRVWVQQGFVEAHQVEYTPLWEDAISRVGLSGVHPAFGERLLTLAMVASVAGLPYPGACAALAADPDTAGAAADNALALLDQHVLSPHGVLAAAVVPTTDDAASGHEAAGVDAVVARVGQHLVASREFTDDDVDAVVSVMAQMNGLGADEAPRRYRRMVQRFMSQRPEGQPSLAARIRGGR